MCEVDPTSVVQPLALAPRWAQKTRQTFGGISRKDHPGSSTMCTDHPSIHCITYIVTHTHTQTITNIHPTRREPHTPSQFNYPQGRCLTCSPCGPRQDQWHLMLTHVCVWSSAKDGRPKPGQPLPLTLPCLVVNLFVHMMFGPQWIGVTVPPFTVFYW